MSEDYKRNRETENAAGDANSAAAKNAAENAANAEYNENLTEIVFILDRSGSMRGQEESTIAGFNSAIKEQKDAAGTALVSTVLFDHDRVVLHDRVDLREIRPMTHKEYWTRGNTALLDAVGYSIRHISNIHKYARKEDVPAKTLFFIVTDGRENASRRFRRSEIKKMIKEREEKHGWSFIYLGANVDAFTEARSFGIRREHAFDIVEDARGNHVAYNAIGNLCCDARMSRRREVLCNMASFENRVAPIDEDFALRSGRQTSRHAGTQKNAKPQRSPRKPRNAKPENS